MGICYLIGREVPFIRKNFYRTCNSLRVRITAIGEDNLLLSAASTACRTKHVTHPNDSE